MKEIKEIREIVESAVKSEDTAINSIVKSVKDIQALPNLGEYIDSLLYEAVAAMVYEERHRVNLLLKKETRYQFSKNKQKIHQVGSKAMATIFSYYEFKIAGRNLGDIFGREIPDIVSGLTKSVVGINKNIELLTIIAQQVPENSTVRDALNQKKIKAIFMEVYGTEPSVQ